MYNPQRNNTSGSTKNEQDLKQSHLGDNLIGDNIHLARLAKSSLIAQKSNDSLPIVIQHHLANQNLLSNQNYHHQNQIYKPKNGISAGSGSNTASTSSQNANLNTNKYFLNKEEVVISIEGFRFQPSSLYVHCGTKLIWQVKQNKPQYNSLYDSTGPRFFIVSIPQLEEESPPIHENESYSYVIDQLGSFDMLCPNYTRMKGALVVVDKGITMADLTKDLQPKYFMEQVDEFKYASSGLNNTLQSQQLQINSANLSAQQQFYQSPQTETPLHILGQGFESNARSTQTYNPLTAYYNDNNYTSLSTHSNSSNNLSHINLSSSQPNLQKNQLYYQMSSSSILQNKETRIDAQFNTEIVRKNSNEKLSLAHSPSLTLFQTNSDANDKTSIENLKQLQSSKQEKILTKIIDSSRQETAESEKIAKQFLQELQEEQNNQPNKKKNAHYLQLYKDDFQEDIDEDEEDLEYNDQMKKKKNNNKLETDSNNNNKKKLNLSQSTEYSNSSKKGIDESKSQISNKSTGKQIHSSLHQSAEVKDDKIIKEFQIYKKDFITSAIDQTLSTPKRKSVQKKELSNSRNQKQQIKKTSSNNSCNSSSSSQQISSQQQIPPIKEEENDISKEQKQSQSGQKVQRQQMEAVNQDISLDKQNDDTQTGTCCASSSTITTNATILATEEKQQPKVQEEVQQGNKNKHISQFLQSNKQVKQLKKFNPAGQANQTNDPSSITQKGLNDQGQIKDGYHSDYEGGQDEEDEDEEDIKAADRRKKAILLNQGGNPANSLYFKGHNFQYFRNQHSNQYGCMGIANEDDEYDDDEEEYDCNTIISEEDASVYTSKENSLVYRRNNSSSNLHSAGSGMIGSNMNPNNSFTASQTLNKRFTKRIRRNQRKKPKIGGLSESYLKSPAQSILTTAESSKYSDTTKQLSQKGDFELEGSDMHERGGLLFQHKYSQKRRASTDQTIQESRYHNNNEDSDTRSIKSLKNEPNIINSNNLNANVGVNTNPCGGNYGCQNPSCTTQNYNQSCNPYDCCNESDNESECTDLFSKYSSNKFVKNNQYFNNTQTCCHHTNSNANIFDFLKHQSKIQFLNFTENINHQNIPQKRHKSFKQGTYSTSSNQSAGSLEGLTENREESKSFSSQNTNNPSPLSQINQQNQQKLIENYTQVPTAITNEISVIPKILQLTTEKNEQIQDQINFVKSFLEQRYEVESWLLTAGAEDLGEVEDY